MRKADAVKPRDTEKQSYKFLLDAVREQLLKPKTIEESPWTEPAVYLPEVAFPEGKKYFRIREVAEILDVETHVLRYWETEFKSIRPKKTRSGQRIYERNEVRQLALVHHLLHVEKFSLQGAKQKLAQMRKGGMNRPPSPSPAVLQELALEVRRLLSLINQTLPANLA